MSSGWTPGISGPIPSHSLYEANADFDSQQRSARIRQAAAAAAAASEPPGPPQSRGGESSRDFIRENARHLREVAEAARAAKEASAASAAAGAPRQKRFAWIEPRVYSDLPERYRSDSARQQFLRAHEKTGPDPLMDDKPVPPFPRDAPVHKLTIPKASVQSRPSPAAAVDFVRANANAAGRRPPSCRSRRSPSPRPPSATFGSEGVAPPDSYKRGQLPSYLMRRRQLWADSRAAEEASRPDPEQPTGHRRLDEAERLKTLALLQDGQSRLLDEINRLPITADTLRARQRKCELETQLSELDQAIKVFSRLKVFVKMDE